MGKSIYFSDKQIKIIYGALLEYDPDKIRNDEKLRKEHEKAWGKILKAMESIK